MKYKVWIVLFIVTTLLIGVVEALGGIRSRQERVFDPNSRAKYFSDQHIKPMFGFGSKDAPDAANAKGSFGSKAAGGVRNKLYNSLISQGRNPKRVSHYDAGYKGSRNLDKTIYFRPASVLQKDAQETQTYGFARMYSQEYEQNARLPFTETYITIANGPALTESEVAGAWLADEDTGYMLHLGNFLVGRRGTGSFTHRIFQFFGPYDKLLITREPLNPAKPLPGEVVFIGDLK